MRRRLVTLALATTSLVAIAFLVPLWGLVGTLADDRAVRPAELVGRSLAPASVLVDATTLRELVLAAGRDLDGQVAVVLPDDTVVGAPVAVDAVIEQVRRDAVAGTVVDGADRRVLVPAIGPDGVSVVDVRVRVDRAGVWAARAALGVLGGVLVAGATWLAARTGRRTTDAFRRLELTAGRLSDGDLAARAGVDDPPELAAVGAALEHLARRIDVLLTEQREEAADLSHGLRTPLTALRLDVEALPPGPDRDRVLEDLAALDAAVGDVITRARRPVPVVAGADVLAVVAERVAFWEPLAADEGRRLTVALPSHAVRTAMPAGDLASVLDVLLDNVFRHTPAGTTCAVEVVADGRGATLSVRDDGPGFPDDADALARGWTSGTGTGLGTDIARRLVRTAGGDVSFEVADPTAQVGRRGALVRLRLPGPPEA